MKFKKEDLGKLIVLLRFGCIKPNDLRYRCLTYTKIAQLVGKSTTFVRNRILEFLNSQKYIERPYKVVLRSRIQRKSN
jgi:hypothetical protein